MTECSIHVTLLLLSMSRSLLGNVTIILSNVFSPCTSYLWLDASGTPTEGTRIDIYKVGCVLLREIRGILVMSGRSIKSWIGREIDYEEPSPYYPDNPAPFPVFSLIVNRYIDVNFSNFMCSHIASRGYVSTGLFYRYTYMLRSGKRPGTSFTIIY